MTRLAEKLKPLGELVDLIETARFVLDRPDAVADAQCRLARTIEAAVPLARRLLAAARDDDDALYLEELEKLLDDEEEEDTTTTKEEISNIERRTDP